MFVLYITRPADMRLTKDKGPKAAARIVFAASEEVPASRPHFHYF
jgi:hypothetical protein